jgi:ABC-type amino acid transport substrate-binding protein
MELEPYGIIPTNKGQKGIFADIMQSVGKRSGFDFKVGVFTISRLLKQLKRKQSDCSILLKIPTLDQMFVPIGSIGWEVETVIYAKPPYRINKYEDLYGLNVAVPRGAQFGHKFDQDDQIARYYTDTYRRSVTLLNSDKVEAVIGTRPSLDYIFAKKGIALNAVSKPYVLDKKEIYVYCRTGVFNQTEIKRLKHELQSLRANGEIAHIINQYLPK